MMRLLLGMAGLSAMFIWTSCTLNSNSSDTGNSNGPVTVSADQSDADIVLFRDKIDLTRPKDSRVFGCNAQGYCEVAHTPAGVRIFLLKGTRIWRPSEGDNRYFVDGEAFIAIDSIMAKGQIFTFIANDSYVRARNAAFNIRPQLDTPAVGVPTGEIKHIITVVRGRAFFSGKDNRYGWMLNTEHDGCVYPSDATIILSNEPASKITWLPTNDL